jgi:stearoyl-CoA desaturase (delta-9 desaturase)
LPWGILIGGEELHNNHHTYATSAKLSNKWYEFDIGWMYIRLLEMARLATVKKVAPTPKFSMPRAQIDLDNLHAVISNRYDVMAKYAKSLKRATRDEIAMARESDQAKAEKLLRAKRLLHKDLEKLSDRHRARVSAALADNAALRKLHDMRVELASIWERSSASREQLLVQLQDWCKRAEESGIRSLQEFSTRLRSYA